MLAYAVSLSAAQNRAETGPRTPRGETPKFRRTVLLAVRRAKQGDEDALRFLYVVYAERVRGHVRNIIRDDHEAEDVTQIVFAKLMTKIVKYDERAAPFYSWLLRVAHNAAIDHIRSNRPAPVPEVYGADEPACVDLSDLRESLEAALATLTEEQRHVVLLRHVVGLSPGEIAERLGRTESAVHGLHHRGRRALQLELIRLNNGPSTSRPGRERRRRSPQPGQRPTQHVMAQEPAALSA
ncbi:MAG: polymerase, sigma-24 subunit, subfamily [Solirubrobacterales bacterium]|nr:polymerase, sigma-24 subunit, subfamily [Solirubrobacterales bacterium]